MGIQAPRLETFARVHNGSPQPPIEKRKLSTETPMTEWPTSFLGRLPIVQTDLKCSARGFVAEALGRRGMSARPFYSTSANGQVLALCGKDADFLALMHKADQIHADGMPMVLYS